MMIATQQMGLGLGLMAVLLLGIGILFYRLKAIQSASEECAFYLRKMSGGRKPAPGEAQAGFRDRRTR